MLLGWIVGMLFYEDRADMSVYLFADAIGMTDTVDKIEIDMGDKARKDVLKSVFEIDLYSGTCFVDT